MSRKLNPYSSRITEPKSQGASQAMLYGTGLTDADMAIAQYETVRRRRLIKPQRIYYSSYSIP